MFRGIHRRLGGALIFCVALCGLFAVPASAAPIPAGPPQNDVVYQWPGSKLVTVNIESWGSGWVRSEGAYRIDCPLACVRAYDLNQDVTLSAHYTPGFNFDGWQVCAADAPPAGSTVANSCTPVECKELAANPASRTCTFTVTADMYVVAKFGESSP
jgi:hypothetical protein